MINKFGKEVIIVTEGIGIEDEGGGSWWRRRLRKSTRKEKVVIQSDNQPKPR